MESAPAGMLWILPASDCFLVGHGGDAVLHGGRIDAERLQLARASARPRNCSTVLRSACDATEATWSVPIMPAFAYWIGDQTISTINKRQSVLAQTDFI